MYNSTAPALDRRGNNETPLLGNNIKIKTNGRLELECDTLDLEANTTNLDEYVSGGGGGADKSYVHHQQVASSTWEINHNLNKYPSVTILDSTDEEVFGNIKYVDKNNLILSFSSGFSGKAFLN